jgi:hypothetical protein
MHEHVVCFTGRVQAFPETLELRPQATATFRLAFRPPRDGQYYCQVRD